MGFKSLIGTRVLLLHMMAVVEEFQKNWNSSMRTAESSLGTAAGGRWHTKRLGNFQPERELCISQHA